MKLYFSPENGVPSAGRYRVGFRNNTGRDVTLTVDGIARFIPRDSVLILTLGPTFTWRRDLRPLQTEEVPANRSSVEIVLRP
jgi:hypothetical protein